MRLKKVTAAIASLFLSAQLVFAQNVTTSVTETTNSVEKAKTVEESANKATTNSVNIDNFNNNINAEAYVVIDSTTGEKIMGKNENKVMYPASLTKIVTSLLLLESGKLDDMFLVSKEASQIGEASIYVQEGEKLSGKDLLYAMMLQSANDSCFVVAEGVSGNAENFYSLMTQRAKEIGATSSNFTSANGLHEPDHVTTAMDLALITKEALKYDEFREVMGQKKHTLTRDNDKGMKSITNKNRMLFPEKPEYNQYAIGGKTAYTTPAGNCLMEVAKKDDMEIIVITMKSKTIYPDTNKIINFAFDNFVSKPIVEDGEFVQEYKGKFLNLYTEEGVGYIAPKEGTSTNTKTASELIMNQKLTEIKAGDKVGIIKTYINDKEYRTIDVFAKEDYTFITGVSFRFIKNIIAFILSLVAIKIGINIYKMRKAKTRGYLKNSRFY